MREVLGNRSISLSRELTKKFEEFLRGNLEEVIDHINEVGIKGECLIVIEGRKNNEEATQDLWWSTLSIVEHVEHYIEKGNNSKEAVKLVSKDRELSKREVYKEYHQI